MSDPIKAITAMAAATPTMQDARAAVQARMDRHRERLASMDAADNPLRMSLAAGLLAAEDAAGARALCQAVLDCDPDHGTAAQLTSLIDTGLSSPREQIDLARALVADGHHDSATILLHAILAQKPKSVGAHVGLIDIAISRDDLAAALERCDHVLGFAPDSKGVRNRRGIVLKRQGQTDPADKGAPLLDIGQTMQTALAHLSAQEPGRADESFARILAVEPAHRGALTGRIRAAIARAEPQEALDACDRALAHFPDDQDILTQRAVALLKAGRTAEAMSTAQALLDKAPNSARIRSVLARALLADGQDQAAEAMFLDTLTRHPQHFEALFGLVDTALARQDFNGALARCSEALEQRPGHSGVQKKQAQALQLSGRLAEAVDVLNDLHRADPADAAVSMRLAEACRKLGDLERADSLFLGILQADPHHHGALLGRIDLAEQRGDIAAALDLVEQARQVDPAGSNLLLRQVELFLASGATDRPATSAEALVQSFASLPEPDLLRVAKLAEKRGLFDLSAAALTALSERREISLGSANYILQLSKSADDDASTRKLADALLTRVKPRRRRQLIMDAAALCSGPQEAIRIARSADGPARTASEADQLGRILLEGGQALLAMRYLRRALRAYPQNSPLKYRFIAACIGAGRPEVGERYLDEFDPDHPPERVLQLRIKLLIDTGRMAEAQPLIRAYRQSFGKTIAVPTRIRLHLALGQLDEARALSAEFAQLQGRGGKMGAHFSTSLIGGQINELSLYQRVAAAATTEAERRKIETEYCRVFTYPAIRILSAWRKATTPATPADSAIPKRIVQYWNQSDIPTEIAGVMRHWQRQPGYDYTCFDRRKALQFLAERFDRQVVSAFRLANHPAEESDFLRLCALWVDGGIYADADDMVVGDLDALLAQNSGAILFQEQFGAIANNVICARPGHPLIKTALDMACDALIARANDGTWTKTGPGLLTRAAAAYVSDTAQEEAREDLLILPQYRLHRYVFPHLKLSYKATPKYWAASDAAVPTPIRDVLARFADSPATGAAANA